MDLNHDIYGEIVMEYFGCQTDLLEKDNIPKIEYKDPNLKCLL